MPCGGDRVLITLEIRVSDRRSIGIRGEEDDILSRVDCVRGASSILHPVLTLQYLCVSP